MVKQTQVNGVQNPWVMMEGDCHKRPFILPYIYIHMYEIYIYIHCGDKERKRESHS